MAESKLAGALIAALSDPGSAERRIREVGAEGIETSSEADLIVRFLKSFPVPPNPSSKHVVDPSLQVVLELIQGTENKEAITLLREAGGPELLRIFDGTLPVATTDNKWHAEQDLLFLLKVISILKPKGGLERLVTAVRSPWLMNGYLWSVIFNIFANERHPWYTDAVEALRDPLPDGYCAVAYLDLCNTLARSGKLARHPFDTEVGLARLQGWLVDEENLSYGHSAAASIPFLSRGAREKVQAFADQHPERDVQLEAAWAAAACGEARGYLTLEAACTVPQEASAAMQYLTELGAEDRIPASARSDDFKAISRMCEWLAHPMEFGRPPQEIRQVDTRELFWPPTNDRRRLWLFLYEYPPSGDKSDPDIGFGMVGSVTFALFGETTPELSAEQVYGLHCVWELERNRDSRAPGQRSAEAGIQILRENNPGFGGC